MNRYTKSILGLMEQNDEGEWVRYTDARYEMRQVELKNDSLQVQLNHRDFKDMLDEDLRDRCKELSVLLQKLGKISFWLTMALMLSLGEILHLISKL